MPESIDQYADRVHNAQSLLPTVPDITTHNGILTIKSVKSGEHRTFKISTQKADAKFAPGKRIVSLLTGPDNTTDFTGFAFLYESHGDPSIIVWKSKRGGTFDQYADMLMNLHRLHSRGKIEINFQGTCRVCNRTLTTPESVNAGIGPICAGR